MLKLRKKGKLPPLSRRLTRQATGRKLEEERFGQLRKDQYRIEGNKLILKGLGAIGRIELGYKGLYI